MKDLARYTFEQDGIVHDIQLKINQNSKIGEVNDIVLLTYHYSIDQIKENSLLLDFKNCIGCPYSFAANSGKSGGCYTHKGMQGTGIRSKLKSLAKQYGKNKIGLFCSIEYAKFVDRLQKINIDLCRFGAYGEPVTLPLQIVADLATISKGRFVGYTHAWNQVDKQEYKVYFMASTHNIEQYTRARVSGWRCFTVSETGNDETKQSVLCPASKQAGNKVHCSACQLCKGTGSGAKSVFIPKH